MDRIEMHIPTSLYVRISDVGHRASGICKHIELLESKYFLSLCVAAVLKSSFFKWSI